MCHLMALHLGTASSTSLHQEISKGRTVSGQCSLWFSSLCSYQFQLVLVRSLYLLCLLCWKVIFCFDSNGL